MLLQVLAIIGAIKLVIIFQHVSSWCDDFKSNVNKKYMITKDGSFIVSSTKHKRFFVYQTFFEVDKIAQIKRLSNVVFLSLI